MENNHPLVPFDTGTTHQERKPVGLNTEDCFKNEDCEKCNSHEDLLSSSKERCEGQLSPGTYPHEAFLSSSSLLGESVPDSSNSWECLTEETQNDLSSFNHQKRNIQQSSVTTEKLTANALMAGASGLKLCPESDVRTKDYTSNTNQAMSSMPNLEHPLLEMLNRTRQFEEKYKTATQERDDLAQKLTATEVEKLKGDKELNRLQFVIKYLRSDLVERGKVKIELPPQLSTTNNNSNKTENVNISTGSGNKSAVTGQESPWPMDLDETRLVDNNSTKLQEMLRSVSKDQDQAKVRVKNSASTVKRGGATPESKVCAERTKDSKRENKTIPGGDFHENDGYSDELCLMNCPEGRSCNNMIALDLQRRKTVNLEDALQVEKEKNCYLESQITVLKGRFASHNLNKSEKIPESDVKSQETIVKDLQTVIEVLQQQMALAVEDFEKEKSDKAKISSSLKKLKENFEYLRTKIHFYKQQLSISNDNFKEQTRKSNILQQNSHDLHSEMKKKDKKISQLSEQLWYFQRLSAQPLPTFTQIPQAGANGLLQKQTKLPFNSQKWPCDACTYSNSEPRTVCEMCGKLRNSNNVNRSTRLVSRGLSTDEGLSNRLQLDPNDCETFSTI